MSIFGRTFPIEWLDERVLADNSWLVDMLSHWSPAGDAHNRDIGRTQSRLGEDPNRLRLAIRNNYFSLYRGGQSIARISFSGDKKLKARIHSKYINGEGSNAQTYATLTSAGIIEHKSSSLRPYRGTKELGAWIANANRHTGEEKKFVDMVVARNPDTIDLEMALPAYSRAANAPRMDLVALEPAGDRWKIVFWEAKLVDDGRARCRGDDVKPKVIEQVRNYTDWLRHGNHRELVAVAYQETCRLLVSFRKLVLRVNPEIEKLGPGIIANAAPHAPPLLVDDEPRLLIDDRTENVAFAKNGHLGKLRSNDLYVQMVQSVDGMTLETRRGRSP